MTRRHADVHPGLATLKGGGKTVVTSGGAVAKLTVFKRGTRITVTAPGYAPASFRKT